MSRALREDYYFEPRVISSSGKIRWYGEEYSSKKTEEKSESTVYIRDTGGKLLIYELYLDDTEIEELANRVSCVFVLVDSIPKLNDKFAYGRLRK